MGKRHDAEARTANSRRQDRDRSRAPRQRKLGLELTEAAKEAVAEAGWDPAYGARPLKRALQRPVENPLELKLLEGEFAEGDTVRLYASGGGLVFEKRAPVEAASA